MPKFHLERVPSTAVMYRFGEIKGVRIVFENSGGRSPLTDTLGNRADVLAELDALIGDLKLLRQRAEAAHDLEEIANP